MKSINLSNRKIAVNLQPLRPYKHQEVAIKDALRAFKTADRATLVMPCGTGKTLACLWVAERLRAKAVVIFVPSLALIHQTALAWVSAAAKKLTLFAICSDDTVAKDEDGILVEKDEFWFPVSNNVYEINQFLGNYKSNKDMLVIFCTYQSSFTLAEALIDFSFDIGIFDEAHRTAVRGESYFSAPLTDEYVPIKKRLFVTATPKQYSIIQKNKLGEFESILSMDSEQDYGKHVHKLSFRRAIAQNIISDYKIVFPEVTSSMVAKEMHLREQDNMQDAVYNVAMQIALKKAIKHTGASKIITFHTRVAEAEQFADVLQKNKILPSFTVLHVNGMQPSSRRKFIMQTFTNKPKTLITNARCLTEGIDAPSVDMVAFLSPKTSKIDIIQAIGRALRKSPGKKYGYIMLPAFVDTAKGETYEDALAKPEMRTLFEVLLALEQHDEMLCEAIKTCKFNEGIFGFDFPDGLDSFMEIVAGDCLTSRKFKSALSVFIINRIGCSWDKMMGALVCFREKHGHCNVPRGFKENKSLANWVNCVRRTKKNNKLLSTRLEELTALGFRLPVRVLSSEQRAEERRKAEDRAREKEKKQQQDAEDRELQARLEALEMHRSNKRGLFSDYSANDTSWTDTFDDVPPLLEPNQALVQDIDLTYPSDDELLARCFDDMDVTDTFRAEISSNPQRQEALLQTLRQNYLLEQDVSPIDVQDLLYPKTKTHLTWNNTCRELQQSFHGMGELTLKTADLVALATLYEPAWLLGKGALWGYRAYRTGELARLALRFSDGVVAGENAVKGFTSPKQGMLKPCSRFLDKAFISLLVAK